MLKLTIRLESTYKDLKLLLKSSALMKPILSLESTYKDLKLL